MKRISIMRNKLRGLTPREALAEALRRTTRRISRATRRIADQYGSTYITDDELKSVFPTSSFSEVRRQFKEPFVSVLPGLIDLNSTTQTVRQLMPESVEAARLDAEEILQHRIVVFEKRFDLGPEIDWHRDPLSGERWNLEHYTRVPLQRGSRADVRVVWELNRLHHLVLLGRSYALIEDERYAEEFLIQVVSWYEQNPPRFGINWTVSMEAAIRAINLLAAFHLFRHSPHMNDDAVDLLLRLIIAHGRHIRSNLEFSHRVRSNHYLSNVLGLFLLGSVLPAGPELREWTEFGRSALRAEFETQVFDDGVSYEGAVGYHRLVLEMFALWSLASRASGVEPEPGHYRKLAKMFEFVLHYIKPDGTAPAIGDSDDGRVIKFKERPAIDHSYLLSIAAVLFNESKFKSGNAIDEETIWWFGNQGATTQAELAPRQGSVSSHAFNDSQIFVQREADLYAIIDCGDHGAGGYGSHAHSDALSLELFANGSTFLRDPGTFVYSGSRRWRNKFRSTPFHNTVAIDNCDISEIPEASLFTLSENVRPRVLSWSSSKDRDYLEAEHHAYKRLRNPVVHRRALIFNKPEGYWILNDSFSGQGTHRFEFFFNFDSGLRVTLEGLNGLAKSASGGLAILPLHSDDVEARITTRWVSLSYGTRKKSSGIIYRFEGRVPFEKIFLLIPYEIGNEAKVKKIQDTGYRIQDSGFRI